jgi:hypothetical protein
MAGQHACELHRQLIAPGARRHALDGADPSARRPGASCVARAGQFDADLVVQTTPASAQVRAPYIHRDTFEKTIMRMSGKAPTGIVWIICLILYVVALAGQFGGVRMDPQIVTWSWIIGLGLLLLACRVRGL